MTEEQIRLMFEAGEELMRNMRTLGPNALDPRWLAIESWITATSHYRGRRQDINDLTSLVSDLRHEHFETERYEQEPWCSNCQELWPCDVEKLIAYAVCSTVDQMQLEELANDLEEAQMGESWAKELLYLAYKEMPGLTLWAEPDFLPMMDYLKGRQ